MMKIPFVDLKAQYLSIKDEIDSAIQKVLDSAQFIKGPQVEKFEKEFAEYAGAKYCVGVGNGTDALYLALRALGVGPGDEVITVPNTFIATTEAISLTGAKIVWCDIDYDTYLIDANKVENLITEKTKAILPVHLYGNVAELEPLRKIADKYNLYLISDAAQAHGAKYKGKDINYYSDVTTYSFYPGKNLGAYGDGGAVVTDDSNLAKKVRMIANHGREEKYIHKFEGINSRLDSLQAAILSVKLKHLDEWNAKRKIIARSYSRFLQKFEWIKTPTIRSYVDAVFHLYVIELKNGRRDELKKHLAEMGINTGIHYPVPLHKQPAYIKFLRAKNERLGYIEEITKRILSLPIYPEMNEEDLHYIFKAFRNFIR